MVVIEVIVWSRAMVAKIGSKHGLSVSDVEHACVNLLGRRRHDGHVGDDEEMTPEEFRRLRDMGEPVQLARRRPRSVIRESVSIKQVVGPLLVTPANSAIASATDPGTTTVHADHGLSTVGWR